MDIRVAGVQIEDRAFTADQLSRFSLEFGAFDFETGEGSLAYPVPLGTDNPPGSREVVIEDSGVTIINGFIGPQDRTRVGSDILVPNREYTVTVRDANALAGGFITYQVRPEETDVDRVLAFVGNYRPLWDLTMVLTTTTVTMPAKTYRDADGFFSALLQDCREASGKTMFVHDKRDGSGICFHYHSLLEGHTADLVLTDVYGDVDYADVWPVVAFPRRNRNPADLATKVVGTDQAGRRAVVEDATQSALHDADGMAHEALIEFEAQSQAELVLKTQIAVTERSRERETFFVGAPRLTAAAMAKWNPGDLINVTANVLGLPGTIGPLRIAHATVTLAKDANGVPLPGFYDCLFELGQPLRVTKQRTSGGNNVINRPITPFVPSGLAYRAIFVNAQPSFVGALSTTTNITPNAGELLVAISKAQDIGTHSWPAGWTEALDDNNTAGSSSYAWKIADGTETSVTVTYSTSFVQRHLAVLAFPGGTYTSHVTPAFAISGTTQTLPDITPGTGSPVILIATAWSKQAWNLTGPPSGYTERSNAVADSGTDSSRHAVYTRAITAPSGAYGGTVGYASALQGWVGGQIVISGSIAAPVYGQKTCEEVTVDGTVGPFTLNFPYLAGSLEARIKSSGLVLTLDETDPAAGEFELDSALTNGTVIVVCYQATGDDATGGSNPQPDPVVPTPTAGTSIKGNDVTPAQSTPLPAWVKPTGTGVITADPQGRVNLDTGADYKAFPSMTFLEGRLHLVYRHGTEHNSSGGLVKYRTSDDLGRTWSSATTLITPTAGDDCRDPYITALSSGRLLLMYMIRSPWDSSPAAIQTYARYSDDRGQSWSSAYTMPNTLGDDEVDVSGPAIELADGTLLQPGYGDDSASGLYKTWVWTSTDGGLTWPSQTLVAQDATASLNEIGIRQVASGQIVALMRDETSGHTYRSVSTDLGATWSAEADVLSSTAGRPDFVEFYPQALLWFGRGTSLASRWAVSWNAGSTWTALQETDSGETKDAQYHAPVVLAPGYVVVVYSIENSSTDADLYVRWYYDGYGIDAIGEATLAGLAVAGIEVDVSGPADGEVLTYDSGTGTIRLEAPTGGSPADDTQVWMPLTTRVGGDLVLVADGDDGGLIPTLVPLE